MEERERAVLAATLAATFKPDFMTNDKIEAATKGHGTLVIPVFCAANSIAEDMFGGVQEPEMKLMSEATLVDAAAPQIPLDLVIQKAVNEAKNAGASPENAALIVAALAYFAGAVLGQELQYIGHTIINVTVPAAVAAILGMDENEAAKKAENGAYLTRAIPGARNNAKEVAKLAKLIYSRLVEGGEILP